MNRITFSCILLALCVLASNAAQPTGVQQHQTAQNYLTVSWTPNLTSNTYRSNYTNRHSGRQVPGGAGVEGACAFVAGQRYIGEAYCWGGSDDVPEFLRRLSRGAGAGANEWHDSTTNYPKTARYWPQPNTWATGIDCSKFVSKLWTIPPQGTTTLEKYAFEIKPESFTTVPALYPRQGDVWNMPRSHVVWIERHISQARTIVGGMPVYMSEDDIYQAAGWRANPQNRVQENFNQGRRVWNFKSGRGGTNSGYKLLRLDLDKPVVSITGPQYATTNATNQTIEWIGDVQLTDNASYEVVLKYRVFKGKTVQVFEKIVTIALKEVNGQWRPIENQDFGAIKVDGSGNLKIYWRGEGATTDGEYRAEVSVADLVGKKYPHCAQGQGWLKVDRTFYLHRLGSIRGTVSSQDGGALSNLNVSLGLKTNPIAGWNFSGATQSVTPFQFSNLGAGTYKLTFNATDHELAVREVRLGPWQDVIVPNVLLYPPKPSISVKARQYGVRNSLVGAVDVAINISGPVNKSLPAGDHGNAGKALFRDVNRGTYRISAVVKTLNRYSYVRRGQTYWRYYRTPVTVSTTVTVSGNRTYYVALPDPPLGAGFP